MHDCVCKPIEVLILYLSIVCPAILSWPGDRIWGLGGDI